MDFPSLKNVLVGYASGSQLAYSQIYVSTTLLSPSNFEVSGGQSHIGAFGSEEVRCLSLLILTISHNTSDGQRISCSLL